MGSGAEGNRTILSLVRGEALAYLKLGLLTPMAWQVAESTRNGSRLGVLFVPGVGATGSQFLPIKAALRSQITSFDSFSYWSHERPETVVERLRSHVEVALDRCSHLLLIGHSLGGVLCRLLLQSDPPPQRVLGFVSICAPLHGTWRSKLAPHPRLRALAPDSNLMTMLASSAHRLDAWKGRILTIGAENDPFVKPSSSAFIDGSRQLKLGDVAHVGSLLDSKVSAAIADFTDHLLMHSAGSEPERAR